MTQPWFCTAQRIDRLAAEARAWLRTPFCLHAEAKGAGVDCVHLAHALAAATGWPHAITAPDYTASEGMHVSTSKLHDYLDAASGIERVGEFPAALALLMPGDLVTFVVGRSAHHLGMVIEGRTFVHVMSAHFVCYATLDDGTWGRRASRLYRLVDDTPGAPAPVAKT